LDRLSQKPRRGLARSYGIRDLRHHTVTTACARQRGHSNAGSEWPQSLFGRLRPQKRQLFGRSHQIIYTRGPFLADSRSEGVNVEYQTASVKSEAGEHSLNDARRRG